MKEEKFECTCAFCISSCSHTPGWFLPGEVEKTAEYLEISLQEFFDKYLGVNWLENGWDEETFVLAPCLVGEPPGEEFPSDPRGRCVFFNDKNLCDIHPAKPYECAESRCDVQDDMIDRRRHVAIAKAWESNQDQIKALLGRNPESSDFGSPLDFLLF